MKFLKINARTSIFLDLGLLVLMWLMVAYFPWASDKFETAFWRQALKIGALLGTIEMIGFILSHWPGLKGGLILQGALGGLVSSTATFWRLSFGEEFARSSPKALTQALLMAGVSMLFQCLVIIGAAGLEDWPALVSIIAAQMACLLVLVLFWSGGEAFPISPRVATGNAIDWKRVLRFSLLMVSLVYAMRALNDLFSFSYAWSSFFVSLFEAHGVLAAALSSPEMASGREARAVILAVLAGNLLSKSGIVLVGKNRRIVLPTIASLAISFLASLATWWALA